MVPPTTFSTYLLGHPLNTPRTSNNPKDDEVYSSFNHLLNTPKLYNPLLELPADDSYLENSETMSADQTEILPNDNQTQAIHDSCIIRDQQIGMTINNTSPTPRNTTNEQIIELPQQLSLIHI